jgi:hypothetical protein
MDVKRGVNLQHRSLAFICSLAYGNEALHTHLSFIVSTRLHHAVETWKKTGEPRLLFFVLHGIAAFLEKDVENYGEEDVLIILTRCQNLEKKRVLSCDEGSMERAKWRWQRTPRPAF